MEAGTGSSGHVDICVGCGELYSSPGVNDGVGFCAACATGGAERPAPGDGGSGPAGGVVTSAVRRMRRAMLESGIISRPGGMGALPVNKPGDLLMGRYKVLQELGLTLLSQVYLAFDEVLGRKVVLKYMNLPDKHDLVERFRREASFLASMKHPNIVSVFDTGFDRNCPFMVMEYIEGIDLGRFNAGLIQGKDEESRIRRLLEVIYEICHALDYLHSQGIVHRDIKPANILLDRMGKPFVIDFGVAKRETVAEPMTGTGAVLGTMLYMAPEQAEGKVDDVDARSDLFSFGIMIYQLLTGALPFKGRTYDELVSNLRDKTVIPPSGLNSAVSPQLDRIVMKCIEKDRQKRFPNAKELASELEPLVMGETVQVVGPLRPNFYARYRLPLAIGLNAVAVILVLLNMIPQLMEGGVEGGPSGGVPGRERFSIREGFGGNQLPAGFVRLSGQAACDSGRLEIAEGMVLFGEGSKGTDFVDLDLVVEARSPRRPEELRIGLFVDAVDPTVRALQVRMFPSNQEILVRSGSVGIARARLGPWPDKAARLTLRKRGGALEVQMDGKFLIEVTLPADALRREGRFSIQAINGFASIDEIVLSVKEGS